MDSQQPEKIDGLITYRQYVHGVHRYQQHVIAMKKLIKQAKRVYVSIAFPHDSYNLPITKKQARQILDQVHVQVVGMVTEDDPEALWLDMNDINNLD